MYSCIFIAYFLNYLINIIIQLVINLNDYVVRLAMNWKGKRFGLELIFFYVLTYVLFFLWLSDIFKNYAPC